MATEPDINRDDFVDFLHFLHRECRFSADEIIYVVEKPHKYVAEYAAYLKESADPSSPSNQVS